MVSGAAFILLITFLMVEIVPDRFKLLKKLKISAIPDVAVVGGEAEVVAAAFGSWPLCYVGEDKVTQFDKSYVCHLY